MSTIGERNPLRAFEEERDLYQKIHGHLPGLCVVSPRVDNLLRQAIAAEPMFDNPSQGSFILFGVTVEVNTYATDDHFFFCDARPNAEEVLSPHGTNYSDLERSLGRGSDVNARATEEHRQAYERILRESQALELQRQGIDAGVLSGVAPIAGEGLIALYREDSIVSRDMLTRVHGEFDTIQATPRVFSAAPTHIHLKNRNGWTKEEDADRGMVYANTLIRPVHQSPRLDNTGSVDSFGRETYQLRRKTTTEYVDGRRAPRVVYFYEEI